MVNPKAMWRVGRYSYKCPVFRDMPIKLQMIVYHCDVGAYMSYVNESSSFYKFVAR
jgi:hypothetical protein